MNLRLFVALEPPDPVRRRLVALQEALRTSAGVHAGQVRWTAPERLHLTVQFLGSVPEERLDAVRAAVASAAAVAGPFRLRVHGAGAFPSARRARVVWGGVEDDGGGLATLAAELGRTLGPLGHPRPDGPFHPHLTFGRARDVRGASGLGGALAGAAAEDPVPWRVEEVVLFRSHLDRGGVRHEPLDRDRLGSPRPGPGAGVLP